MNTSCIFNSFLSIISNTLPKEPKSVRFFYPIFVTVVTVSLSLSFSSQIGLSQRNIKSTLTRNSAKNSDCSPFVLWGASDVATTFKIKISCVDKSTVLFQNPWHPLSARIELRFFYSEGVSSSLRSSISFSQIL